MHVDNQQVELASTVVTTPPPLGRNDKDETSSSSSEWPALRRCDSVFLHESFRGSAGKTKPKPAKRGLM